jgi:hypothetical protein
MIYLDMDGVFADFDSHYEFHFGVRPTRWPAPDNVNWNRVNSVPDFYRTIPLMPGARELFRYVDEVGEGCAFLTGVPASINVSANQKIEWGAAHFPETEVICCPARDKWKRGQPGDILIDDYLRYRLDWINMGGVFIHHTDVPSTIGKLRELGKCVSWEPPCVL